MATNQLVRGSGQKPMTVNSGKDLTGDVYLARREFLGNVYAQVTGINTAAVPKPVQSQFQVNSFNINAGLASTFPWLSQVAKNFTFYELHGLVFEYKPTSGEFGNMNTNALGKVVMCTQYDPDAPNFSSSIQMENYDYATACKPSEHMLHGVETKVKQRSTNMLYVRTGPTAKDEILTDLGDFQIATEGVAMNIPVGTGTQTVNIPIGELWVAYKVQLSRANIFNASNDTPTDAHIGLSVGPNQFGTGTAGTGNTFLNLNNLQKRLYALTQQPGQFCPKLTNQLGTQVFGSVRNAGTTAYIVFPPGTSGQFAITATWTGSAAVAGQNMGEIFYPESTDYPFSDLLDSGYQVPSGLLGSLAYVPSTQMSFNGIQSAPSDAGVYTDVGNGIYAGVPAVVSTTITTTYGWVQFTATPSQLPVIVLTVQNAQAANKGVCLTLQVFPTALGSTN